MFQTLDDYRIFVEAVKTSLEGNDHFSSVKLEIVGSLGNGKLSPPYSDIDLLLVSPIGLGSAVRDNIPALAGSIRNRKLLAIFADPFSSSACLCSIYSEPIKVDWFLSEESQDGARTPVWRGNKPPPYDWESHSWDWIWWLWCKARRGKKELVIDDLPRLWQQLILKGTDPQKLPSSIPNITSNRDLLELLRFTIDFLPQSERPISDEIRHAIYSDSL